MKKLGSFLLVTIKRWLSLCCVCLAMSCSAYLTQKGILPSTKETPSNERAEEANMVASSMSNKELLSGSLGKNTVLSASFVTSEVALDNSIAFQASAGPAYQGPIYGNNGEQSAETSQKRNHDTIYDGGIVPVEYVPPPPWQPLDAYNTFAQHCFHCHAQFRDLDTVKALAPVIYSSVTGKYVPGSKTYVRPMPKSGENPSYPAFQTHTNGKIMIAYLESLIFPPIEPTPTPTMAPTEMPTMAPTEMPTMAPTATPTMAPTEMPTATPDSYTTVRPILIEHCGACHALYGTFGTLDGIRLTKDEIKAQLEMKSMPPQGASKPLSETNRTRLLNWLNNSTEF